MQTRRTLPFSMRLVCWLFAALFLAAVSAGCAPESSGGKPTPLAVGDIAPDFSLVTSNGEVYRLEQFRGRPVILYFWTTWCQPCRGEMTTLSERYRQNNLRGPMVLAINSEEEAGKVMDFANASGVPFPLLIDIDGRVCDLYGMQTIPTTYLVDEDGVVQKINVGTMSQNTIDEMMFTSLPQTPTPRTPTSLPEPTATSTATTIPSLDACVTAGVLNIRSGPSTTAEVVDGMVKGECTKVDARSADGAWLRLQEAAEGGRRWAASKFFAVSGPVDALPIAE